MYALCVSGAVNTQGFVWKVFMRYIKKFIHSFIIRLSGLFVTSETYVMDLARSSRLKQAETKFGLIGMHFFLRKYTYFHGIYILLDLTVMLCTRL